MPNWSEPGRDAPTRRDIEDMERDDDRRRREDSDDQRRIDSYLRNHPDASYAEADYYTR